MSKGRLDPMDEEDFDGLVAHFPDKTKQRKEYEQRVAKEGHRAHTPITSESQRGLFGAELARRRAGETPRMEGITEQELEEHLHETGGKKLPETAKSEDSRKAERAQALRLVAKGIAMIVRRLGGGA